MERVNLIPDDVSQTWTSRVVSLVDRRFPVVLAWVVGTVCLMEGLVAAGQGIGARRYETHAAGLEAKRASLVAELENARAYMQQLEQTKQQLQQQADWLTKRLAYLNEYRQTRGEWAEILREIKRALPYGIWLTDLESDPQGHLRLAGGAFSDELIIQFMSQLKATPRFTDVAFTFTKQGKIGKTPVIEFELTCQTVVPQGMVS